MTPTGFEPVLPPWKGGVLTTWPWSLILMTASRSMQYLKYYETPRAGLEPATARLTAVCSTNWATEPSSYCGSRIWTYDLRVMSPTSYLTAPSRDMSIKEDVGFEPTHAFTRLTVFKTVPFSRTWVILQDNNGPCRTWTYDHSVMSREL